MIYVFWLASAFLIYTFAGYPFLLWLVSRIHQRNHDRREYWPFVSLIVVAHNEAKEIAAKISNVLAARYPEEKREILVASDGSNDATAEIVRSFADRGVTLIDMPEQRGKHYAQMIARDKSKGEILVFSDASVRFDPDAVQKIVSNFADSSIGCVSSEDRLTSQAQTAIGEDSYVDFEMRLRRLESKINSLVSVSGSFFAVRREVCAEWNPQQSSDFFLALQAVARGLRAIIDPECYGWYGTTRSQKAEFKRKVRTIVHGLDVLFTRLRFLNPFRFGVFAWQLMSHKLFRWLGPFALIVLGISTCFLWDAGWFYRLALFGQVFLYIFGALGLSGARLQRLRPFKLASFFLIGNAAAAVAWAQYSWGERYASWRPTKRE